MPPTEDATPALLREKPTWLISQVAVHAHRLVADGLASAHARGYDYRVLAALHEFGPTSQATLGRRTAIDKSDVVDTVDGLSRRGLVRRSSDLADRRRKSITITRAGVKHFLRLDKVLVDIQETLLGPLSTTERRVLLTLLARLLKRDANYE